MNQDSRKARNAATISFLAKTGVLAGIGVAAVKLAKSRPATPSALRGKVALITGSRGLGLAIAREFGRRGARIAMCARDQHELHRACESLSQREIEAAPFAADISKA